MSPYRATLIVAVLMTACAPTAPPGEIGRISRAAPDAAPARSIPDDAATSTVVQVESIAPPLPAFARLDTTLEFTGPSGRPVFVVAGQGLTRDKPPAIITFLHAFCIDARETCEFLRPIAAGRAVLVCLTGNAPCGGGLATWGGDPKRLAAEIDADTNAAEALIERPTDARDRDVLFGSSMGGIAARNIINAGTTRFRGLILVGSKVEFDPSVVKRAGIRRVLLVSPDYDAAKPTMMQTRTTLCRAGLDARWVSLGPHGHGMIEDSAGMIAGAMDWFIMGDESDPCGNPR